MATISAKGNSGRIYAFDLYPFDTTFRAIGAVYLFLMDRVVLYVGKTKDLSNRMSGHHKESEARRLGANRIGVLQLVSERDRDLIERDLIASHKPRCNELLK